MDFLSCYCLCVKFSLRLMHNIHSLIDVEKSIMRGHFQPTKANKIDSEKKIIFFSAWYLETMVTYNNQIGFLKFVILHSCTIELILEKLKNIRWIWHQEIRTPCIIFTKLLVWYTPNSLNSKSIYSTLLTHWYPCPKKVSLLLHRGVQKQKQEHRKEGTFKHCTQHNNKQNGKRGQETSEGLRAP